MEYACTSYLILSKQTPLISTTVWNVPLIPLDILKQHCFALGTKNRKNPNSMPVQTTMYRYIPAPFEPPRDGQVSKASGEGDSVTVDALRDDDPQRSDGGGKKQERRGSSNFNILQLNTAGIKTKKLELVSLLKEKNIHLALLQETMLGKNMLSFPGYTAYQCKCEKCQGIMTLIRNDTQATVKNIPCGEIDIQEINVWMGNGKQQPYTIYNIYYPPTSDKDLPFHNAEYKRTIFAGDFNAHLPSLGYMTYNKRGINVEEMCNTSNLILLQNEETPATLLHRAHGTTSRPDLTMASADIIDNTEISVIDDIGSDHRPIAINILFQNQNTCKRTEPLWNFRRANWSKFKSLTDTALFQIEESDDVNDCYNKICNAILEAAKRSIPRGNVKKYKPFWSNELKQIVKERKAARRKAEKHPTPANKTAYNKLTAKVKLLAKKSKKETWMNTCANLNLNRNGHKAWKLLENLQGKKKKDNPQPLRMGNDIISDKKKKADEFNKFFSNVSKLEKRKHLDSALWKQTKTTKAPTHDNTQLFNDDFKRSELEYAMKKLAPKKAPGPDKIKNEMISQLGEKGKLVLLRLINKTWKEGKLPKAWLTAIITPILKPNKPAGDPKSYRPISLTSCIGKLVERMVNNRLYWWLEETKKLNNFQAGFRRGQQTQDQLFRLVQSTIDGFQNKKQTSAVFIDLQQAYDKVWRKGLLIKMHRMGICGKLFKWIQAFLQNRTIATKIDGVLSSKKTIEEGLPQGSALSCTLFLIYLNDITDNIAIQKALFADDLVIWTTDYNLNVSKYKLNKALMIINVYCQLWKLKINTQKTVYSIFTKSHQVAKKSLNLTLNGELLQKEDHPTYLGVQLDRQLTMSSHIRNVKEKATRRLNLIKRLASTNWGSDKKTLRQLYLGYVRSLMDYSLPLQNIASATTIAPLDRIQNQALRLVCGGMKTTPVAACEIDSNVEPLDLRRSRSLLETTERYKRKNEDHPNYKIVTSWRRKQRLKQRSPLDLMADLEKDHQLPPNREKILNQPSIPPWRELLHPTINTSLVEVSAKKDMPPSLLKTLALETIDYYPKDAIHIYTDGSALKASHSAGTGAYVKYPDGTSENLSAPCGVECNNYEAEIKAIQIAVETLHQHFETSEKAPNDAIIFSDSKSALQAFDNIHDCSDRHTQSAAISIHNLMEDHKINITLQWIPGHTNIPGNDMADRLAKEGSLADQPEKACSQQTVHQILKNNFKEQWLNRWATGNTGRAMFSEMTKPKPRDSINSLSRPNQCTIFQLRTGHCKLNAHINRIDPTHPPICRNCPHPYETVNHLLIDCPGLTQQRATLLPPIPTIYNTLYGPPQQLINTCRFLALAVKEQ